MKITRREAILLVLLLIFAVIFAEYQLVVVPGIERYQELEGRNDELSAQIDAINLDLLVAEQRKVQMDETLQEISVYHERFLGELNPSVLLYYTYDLMTRNNFAPSTYTILPVIDAIPYVELIVEHDITYALAELVVEYNRLSGTNEEEDMDTETVDEDNDTAVNQEDSESNITALEMNEFLVNGMGSYEQIKDLLDDIRQQNKSIVVSHFDMIAEENNTIGFNLRIQYYGIRKFEAEVDEFNTWPRPSFDGGTESPFATIIVTEDVEIPEEDEIIEE